MASHSGQQPHQMQHMVSIAIVGSCNISVCSNLCSNFLYSPMIMKCHLEEAVLPSHLTCKNSVAFISYCTVDRDSRKWEVLEI